jgi:glycosyltransferase involved in cell wall biosynthesis
MSDDLDELSAHAEHLIGQGIRRVHVVAWRDLDDPDAGGSEAHADEFMRRFTAAGLEITHRTSAARGLPSVAERNGYRVVRRGGRLGVFPRAVARELVRGDGGYDAFIEIWNGVPWMSPVWCHVPRITIVHHVHGPMWEQILPGPLATFGEWLEARLAPPFYRRTLTVTPSEATREELLELGFRPGRVRAVNNGVDPFFSPGGERTPWPSVVAVGRLAPVKRFDALIAAAVDAHRSVPDLQVSIVGEGPERAHLEAQIRAAGAQDWITLVGRLSGEELRDQYRRAWVVASASLAEGWGLTLTEGAACGTPAVATDINGHRCSVRRDESGLLAPVDALAPALVRVLTDADLRARLSAGALAWAATLTWDASALGVMRALRDEVDRRR